MASELKNEFRKNIRSINEIFENGGEFYRKIIEENGGFRREVSDAYEGIEHSPHDLGLKRPNITKIWNLPFNSGGFLYGSSMGHKHEEYDFEIQEIYEFLGYGGMLVSSEEGNKLYVCRPCDKVIVPSNCSMTILNFSNSILNCMDMANPLENKSSKEEVKKKGPMIAFEHTGKNAEACFYEQYLSERFKARISFPVGGNIRTRLNKNYDEFGIDKDAVIELYVESGLSSMAVEILECKKEFSKYRVEVVEGSRIVSCRGRKGEFYRLDMSLENLAESNGKKIHKMLGMI